MPSCVHCQLIQSRLQHDVSVVAPSSSRAVSLIQRATFRQDLVAPLSLGLHASAELCSHALRRGGHACRKSCCTRKVPKVADVSEPGHKADDIRGRRTLAQPRKSLVAAMLATNSVAVVPMSTAVMACCPSVSRRSRAMLPGHGGFVEQTLPLCDEARLLRAGAALNRERLGAAQPRKRLLRFQVPNTTFSSTPLCRMMHTWLPRWCAARANRLVDARTSARPPKPRSDWSAVLSRGSAPCCAQRHKRQRSVILSL